MSLTTVAELRSALGIGSLYTDASLQEVCNAADNVLLPLLWNNENYIVAHSNQGTVGTLYFSDPVTDVYYVGQTVVISGCGAHYNGSQTITGVGTYSITIATDHLTNTPRHPIEPYGVITADTYTDYSTIPAIQTAALLISIDIWQSRQLSSSSGVAPDGYSPSPFYKMGSGLTARVRGLTAPYLSPRGLVG
jgi:hypothetical protein